MKRRKIRMTDCIGNKPKKHLNMLSSVAAVMFVYGIFNALGIGCPIKFVTGISCIGCGMTRAWLSLLHLDIKEAFYYHPAFWLPPFVLIILHLKYNKNKKIMKYYHGIMISVIVVFVTVYFFRILWPNDIVVFQPENNILSRAMQTYSR